MASATGTYTIRFGGKDHQIDVSIPPETAYEEIKRRFAPTASATGDFPLASEVRQTGGGTPNRTLPESPAAKNLAREVASGMGSGMLAEGALLGLTALGAPTAATVAVPAAVAAGTYYGLNRLMGGDPSAGDVLGASVAPVGSIAKAVGKVGPWASSGIQAGADVAANLIANPEATAGENLLTGAVSLIGNRLGEGVTPSDIPRNKRLEVRTRRQGVPETITHGQAVDLVPVSRSGLLTTGLEDRVGKLIEPMVSKIGGQATSQQSADTARQVLDLLKRSDREWTARELDVIRNTVEALAPADADKLMASVRETVGNMPIGPRMTDPAVQKLLGDLGYDPSVTPRSLGEGVQKVLGRQVKKEMSAAGKAYEPVLEALRGMPDMVNVDLSHIPANFRAELEHAAKFFKPATSIAESTGGPVSIGQLADMVRETNMLQRSIPATPGNKPKKRAMWELQDTLNRVGDEFVRKNPNSPAAAKWQEYAKVREKYGRAAEQDKLFNTLSDDPTELGLNLSRPKSEEGFVPNPDLDTVRQFFGGGVMDEPGRVAAVSTTMAPSIPTGQVEPGQIRSLKKVARTPVEAETIDRALLEMEPPQVPADAQKLVDTLLPLEAADVTQQAKRTMTQASPATRQVWDAVGKMAPEKAEQVRNLVKARLVDKAKTNGMFDPQKFQEVLAAHKGVVPDAELDQIAGVGQVLSENMVRINRPPQLAQAIKVMQGSGEEVGFAKKFADYWQNDPQTAQFLLDTVEASDPKLATQFRANLLTGLSSGPSVARGDKFGQLLDFADNIQASNQEALKAMLGPDNWQTAEDIFVITEHLRPVLATLESQAQGRGVSGALPQLRATTSSAGYAAMLAKSGVGMVADKSTTGAMGGVIFPAILAVAQYPRLMQTIILNPRHPLRQTLRVAAAGLTRGGVAATRPEPTGDIRRER